LRALVTGITGFVGSHMADFLLERGDVEVFGAKRWSSRLRNIRHILDKVRLIDYEITDYTSVLALLEHVRPDVIFHFAAQSFVSPSWTTPRQTFEVNVLGTLNILEVMKQLRPDCRILISGSAEEFGEVHEDEIPITEDSPLRPINPYGVSKVAQDFLAFEHFKSYGQKVIRVRAFNHIGPRRDNVFAFGSFGYQIAMIEKKGKPPVVKVGTLTARRDFCDVRDMVRAYWLASQKGIPGELYCISGGQVHTIREGLDILLGLSTVRDIKIEQDESRVRPTELSLLIADCSKFKKLTQWEPTIPFRQTLEDVLAYWREFVEKEMY
jgi:GDP-4-dehydro-6-deoxy-D-mannose reductase